ncbi:MAG TPA: T9SS type A sorting domain-containing protein [Draconibacterium sp.]|nr:T9SS type A sorting domain-containing protein [Draconibacterium sp.]
MNKVILLVAILLSSFGVLTAQNITKAEYFIDSDLGIGKNHQITVGESASDISLSFTATLAGLEPGLHRLYCRVADENNQWSIISAQPIQVISLSDATNIVYVEYFIDSDPGIGLAKSITISANEVNVSVPIELESVSEGLHMLSVRVKDSGGKWSLAANQPIYVIDDSDIVKITQLEYYFAGTSGDSPHYTFNDFEPASVIDLSESDFLANTSSLEYDQHYTLYVRALNSNGKYSPYSSINFTFKKITTGIDDVAEQDGLFTLYPNPVQDVIYLKGGEELNGKLVNFAVYDQAGKLLLSNKLQDPQINVSSLKAGNYYLVVYYDNNVFGKSFIKIEQ